MSVPDPAPASRPAAVTAAAAVMIFMAAAGLVNAVVGLASIGGVVDRYREAAGRTDASASQIDTLATVAWGTVIAAGVLAVAVAALLIGLALGILRGVNGARIATWILCGVGLLCGACAWLAVVGQAGLSWNVSDVRVTEELTQALTDAYPDWWIVLNGVCAAGQALGYLAVAVLLALPSAHSHFRRRAAGPRPAGLPSQ
ncbi:hypothetical protein WEI85_08935 [Actinomycetes bacterium KLBMP 9797]